jgi:thimet oligopeptidase
VNRFSIALAGLVFCQLALGSAASAQPAPSGASGITWNLTPAQITSTCSSAIARATTRERALIATRGRSTFASVILPLEDFTSDLSDQTVAQTFLFSVGATKPVRDASLKCNSDESAFFTALSASPLLYAKVAAAQRSGTARTPYDRKLTQLWVDTFKRSGAALTSKKRTEFVKLSNQLTDLQNKFQSNLGNDASSITISQAQTASLPADFVAGLKKSGSQYIVPVNESTAYIFLRNERDEDARKSFSFVYNNREAIANTNLLEQAIAVRDHLAHLLGYQNWASYQLSDRMAKSPNRVLKFLDDLDARLLPKARGEIATLRTLKARDTGNANAVLQPWDFSYYDDQLRKTQYAVDTNLVREYFPVQHTIDSVLNIYHTILGVDFKQITPSNAWNPEVLEYSVSDSKTGRFIGLTYFDLFPRPGKFEHFANFPIVPVRGAGAHRRAPIAAIVGNWPRPAAGNPALLSHDDVVTFFHEFGHNMATLLATAPYETLSNGFVTDFVEAPSQMLENFVWQPSVLKQISSNAKTGQPLPDDLIAAMVRARYVDYAYMTTQQIKFAEVDMSYHMSGPHVDTTTLWTTLSSRLTPMQPTPGTHPQASFGHLMGGYDAGYYGYLWSLVYAQDLFTAFQSGGLENPTVGARYRQDILEPARTYDPDIEVQRFLGRPMNTNAFYQQFGTTPENENAGGSGH